MFSQYFLLSLHIIGKNARPYNLVKAYVLNEIVVPLQQTSETLSINYIITKKTERI